MKKKQFPIWKKVFNVTLFPDKQNIFFGYIFYT